jgi:hypothetical protein
MSSFHIDARIDVKLEYEMAIRLGELILMSGTADKQLKALGHKLKNMDSEDEEDIDNGWQETSNEASVSQDWNDKYTSLNTMQEKISQAKRSRKIRWGMD